MLVTLSGMLMVDRLEQEEKAELPMCVTLLEMVMVDKLEQELNT
jgi:hypothetical protein